MTSGDPATMSDELSDHPLTTEEAALYQMMSDLSEDWYCAGWQHGFEYTLWQRMAEDGDSPRAPVMVAIRAWAERIDRWIVWDGMRGPKAIPLDEWRRTVEDGASA